METYISTLDCCDSLVRPSQVGSYHIQFCQSGHNVLLYHRQLSPSRGFDQLTLPLTGIHQLRLCAFVRDVHVSKLVLDGLDLLLQILFSALSA
jgi:hypothetical protein